MKPMTLQQIWTTFQMADLPPQIPPNPAQQLQFDNPFLINYVVYHHYRSLGWVVKGGIKFCVDYLLYKKGPVFAHAEWVLVQYLFLFSVADRHPLHTGWHLSSYRSMKTRTTRNLPQSTCKTPHPSVGLG